MRKLPNIVVCVLSLLIGTAAAQAETTVRVAAWNIANLHHTTGFEVRSGIGTRRTDSDFTTLERYAGQLDADVIALQEIATTKGAERVFPQDKYFILMSGRKQHDIANGITDGIYTAIALRKGAGITVVRQEDIDALGVDHIEDNVARSTRWGTAALLEIAGQKLWFVSVHLKSSCSSTKGVDTSSNRHCQTLWKQRLPLSNWIAERVADDVPFIIAGDYNRRFRQFQDTGVFWSALNNDDLNDPLLVKHPESVTRKCATRKGKSTQPIDWILLDADIAHWFVERSFWETRFTNGDVVAHGGRFSQRLSDHCAIHIDLAF